MTEPSLLATADRFAETDLPAWPQFDDAERAALIRALEQGQWWRVTGREVERFEEEFAAYNGAAHALAVTNGTHALELALRLHGVGPGDEVVVPAFTFISTSLAVQNVGATPVPADVDPVHYCLTPEAFTAALTPRTRAVIPVHMAGHVADLTALAEVADRNGCALIQDAAHAPGASRDGVLVGARPSVACYSFQNGKLMTAGEGGALTFPDRDSFERGYLLHTCGRPRGDVTYQHVTGGSNVRMNEFSAAVLRAQLARLAGQTVVRQDRAARLDALLADVPGLAVQASHPTMGVNPRYMYLLTLDDDRYTTADRDRFVAELTARGVPTCVNFPPVYQTRGFWLSGPTPPLDASELARRCAVSERVCGRGLWIHHRTLLADESTVDRLGRIVAATFAELGHG